MRDRTADTRSTRPRDPTAGGLWPRVLLTVSLVAFVVIVSACGDAGTAPPSGSRAVTFPGPGGTRLAGRELGRGSTLVVLAHGASTTMTSWYVPMAAFADAGYRVLAFDSRGVGESTGTPSTDPGARAEDIEAGVAHAREEGATRIVVMGSSLGAQAALMVASRDEVAAVVGVSPATVPGGLDAITAPAYFVASEGDPGPAESARALGRHFGTLPEIVEGSVHGADLFADHPEAIRAVVRFLRASAP